MKCVADDMGGDQDEQQRRPEKERRNTTGEQADDGKGEPEQEKPELEMKGDDVGRAHELESSSLEGRNERRVRLTREVSEELFVQPAEVVDRLRLRHPERPRVEFVQPCEAPRPEERFEIDQRQARADGARDGSRPREPRAPERRDPTAET